jgi:hypothetical protein
MNYTEKFLEIFSFFIQGKSLEGTKEEDRNGKYVKKEKDGTKKIVWYKNGLIHNDHGPAFIRKGGGFDTLIQWYQNGVIHNDNGPAMITKESSGKWTEEWYQHGELHRDNDKPAIVDSNGNKHWYKNGVLHRDTDKPAIECKDFHQWFINGVSHRDNGPAMIGVGKSFEHWYKNGKLHREDGPAIKAPEIKGFYRDPGEQWWLDGTQVTKEEFNIFLFSKKLEKELPKNNDKPQGKKLKL